ncbi:pyrin domain-containing protein 3-like isoform X3 [Choloepus didactylus]|uniref:pyrin domain-containing protein 3-like isoform X3 n=1 Tax=Choloepus didactylus TaxID=27675 RepID=UPI00189E5CCB|nr:pyrin domain-containing protein 3-like isoform X3 [Choloepus didactylus]
MRVFFLRIQTPRFGFQSEPCAMSSRPPTPYLKSFPPPGNGAPASTTTQLTPDFLIPPMKRMKIRDEKYPGSSRRRRPTKATCGGPVPTWGQIKALTNQAEELVKHQNGVVTPSTLFIAMLAVISCQSSASSSKE